MRRLAAQPLSAQHDAADTPDRINVAQRIGIEQHEIGARAHLDRADFVGEIEVAGRVARGGSASRCIPAGQRRFTTIACSS